MISISQNKNTFHFLTWIPSENGPLVTDFGKIIVNEERNNYIQILEKLKPVKKSQKPIFSVSIDSSLLFFSETPVDNKLDDKKVLDWFATQALGSVNDSTIETFHYPFTSNQNKYFNIHIPKLLKSELITSTRNIKIELRDLGVGIFSAESGARYWFNANKHKSYSVWRIGQPHQILIIREGILSSFFTFNTYNNKIQIINNYGSINDSNKLIKDIQNIYKGNTFKLNNVNHLYFYNLAGNYSELSKLLDSKYSKVTALNPLTKLNIIKGKKYSLIQGLALAETGNSFRGIDV